MSRHYSEDELILHYYGDDERGWRFGPAARRRRGIEQHIDECADCAALYRELTGTLQMIGAPAVPERGAQYGLEVWQRIRARLPEPEAPWWVRWLRWDRLAAAGAAIVVAAFAAGHLWPGAPEIPPAPSASLKTADTATKNGRERILLTSISEHLDRSERVLTDIMNAPDGGDISTEQRWAEDLVSTSRLYRQEAADAGEQTVATMLDELERNLLEVVHSPSKMTAAQLNDMRQRIDAAALLFKVRVLGDELRQRENAPASAPHATAISHIS